jgi:hypothetical protein
MVAACGGSDPTGSNGGTGGGGGGGSTSMQASIDGQAWTSDGNQLTVSAGTSVPGTVVITGTHVVGPTNYKSISLLLAYIGGPGTYPLGVNNVTNAGGVGSVVIASGATTTNWLTPLSGEAGTLTVTTLTATRLAGTFSFVAPPVLGSGASVNVTNGSFDVAVPAGFLAVPATDHGNLLKVSLGGTAWNGATVIGAGNLGAGTPQIGGNSTTYSMSAGPLVAISVGDFAIGSQITVQVTETGTGNSWASLAGSTGTFSFTQVGNARVVGTFSGVLQPVGSASGTLTLTGGQFDVRIP